jgi:hypothetical protein
MNKSTKRGRTTCECRATLCAYRDDNSQYCIVARMRHRRRYGHRVGRTGKLGGTSLAVVFDLGSRFHKPSSAIDTSVNGEAQMHRRKRVETRDSSWRNSLKQSPISTVMGRKNLVRFSAQKIVHAQTGWHYDAT